MVVSWEVVLVCTCGIIFAELSCLLVDVLAAWP